MNEMIKKLKEILGKKTRVTVPNNGLTSEGVRELYSILQSAPWVDIVQGCEDAVLKTLNAKYGENSYKKDNLSGLVDGIKSEVSMFTDTHRGESVAFDQLIGREWLTKDGTLPKRIAKQVKKATGLSLSPELMGEIGSKLAAHCPKQTEYVMDFTQSFDWRAGEFGDSGSCFWTNHKGAKTMMKENGFGAVRFWNTNGDNYGVGRCWVGPTEDDYVILFNGYGPYGLTAMARVISHLTGKYYRKITLMNNREDFGTLYINGGVGFAVGDQSVVEGVEKYDFDIEDENANCCALCGEGMDEDDTFTSPSDEYICRGCYEEKCTCCEKCNETVWCDDCVTVTRKYEETWCGHCYTRYGFKCEECGERFSDTNLNTTTVEGREFALCPSCYEDKVDGLHYCDDCGEWKESACGEHAVNAE